MSFPQISPMCLTHFLGSPRRKDGGRERRAWRGLLLHGVPLLIYLLAPHPFQKYFFYSQRDSLPFNFSDAKFLIDGTLDPTEELRSLRIIKKNAAEEPPCSFPNSPRPSLPSSGPRDHLHTPRPCSRRQPVGGHDPPPRLPALSQAIFPD